MNPITVVLFGAVPLLSLWLASVLSTRREALLEFLSKPVFRSETFDEVVFGVPKGRLPEATSWVLASVTLLLVGGIGAVGLGLGLFVLIRTAPQMVIPTMLFAYAAWTGWRGLSSQAGRVPVVRRLRLTQPHLVVDDLEIGLNVTAEDVEAAPIASGARTVSWSDIVDVGVDDGGSVIVRVRGGTELAFGPLPDDVADDITTRIRRRRSVEEADEGEVIDLARARLRALTERAERPSGDGPSKPRS
ncbi:MAG: hypothetical protein AAF211_04215 [Myxococcota bacterium]